MGGGWEAGRWGKVKNGLRLKKTYHCQFCTDAMKFEEIKKKMYEKHNYGIKHLAQM